MNTQTHPTVARYLSELHDLLGDLDPVERAEVLSGVREHLDAALADRAAGSDQEVQAVLDGLGSPSTVAREAYAGSGGQPRPAARVPLADRPGAPVVVAILELLALLLVVLFVSSSSAVVSTSSTIGEGPGGGMVEQTQVHYAGGSALAGAVTGGLSALPFWLVVAVLVGLSSLWVAREKLLLLSLVPGGALLLGGLPEIGWALVGENGIYAGAWIGLVLVLGGGGWLLWSQTQRGRDRAFLKR